MNLYKFDKNLFMLNNFIFELPFYNCPSKKIKHKHLTMAVISIVDIFRY